MTSTEYYEDFRAECAALAALLAECDVEDVAA